MIRTKAWCMTVNTILGCHPSNFSCSFFKSKTHVYTSWCHTHEWCWAFIKGIICTQYKDKPSAIHLRSSLPKTFQLTPQSGNDSTIAHKPNGSLERILRIHLVSTFKMCSVVVCVMTLNSKTSFNPAFSWNLRCSLRAESLPFLCPVTRLRSAYVVLPTYCLLQMSHVARYTTHRDAHVVLQLM